MDPVADHLESVVVTKSVIVVSTQSVLALAITFVESSAALAAGLPESAAALAAVFVESAAALTAALAERLPAVATLLAALAFLWGLAQFATHMYPGLAMISQR